MVYGAETLIGSINHLAKHRVNSDAPGQLELMLFARCEKPGAWPKKAVLPQTIKSTQVSSLAGGRLSIFH